MWKKRLRTQSFLQRFHVAPLGPALPPNLIIGARVAETRTSAAAWFDAVTFQFPLPANHAGQPLWFRHARVAPDPRRYVVRVVIPLPISVGV